MAKYDILSGKGAVLTVTPFGLLMDILLETDVVIYISKIRNDVEYSFDKISWRTVNKVLGYQLLDMSTYCDNIKIVDMFKEDE